VAFAESPESAWQGQLAAKATIKLSSGSEVSTRDKKSPRAAHEPRAAAV